ncbi:hypothetical protein AA0117_g10963 [Alternaria alternata]|uniref:Rhodopsin domain-containing protein n=1 Tax=Alternaria alternata TaxID=5599 RepID=A0A4Q4N4S4_ALTAL|nr:hypothetical protein AA0117_g10963 [Alternaria alternata]
MSDLRATTISVNLTLICLTSLAISCRIGRKLRILSSFGWHDALATFAASCAIVLSIVQMYATRLGAGLHEKEIDPNNMEMLMKLVMTALIFYFLVNWAVKHSLLFFYAELTFEPWARRWIYAMHVIAFSFGLTCVVTSIFMCIPVAKWWDPTIEGYCINLFNFSYFNSVFMLACDLVLYIMPVIFTWNIKLRRHHRIAVNILFAMGGLVLGASAARIFFVDQLATHGDFPFRYAASMICAVIENHLAVIVACAPSIKAVLIRYYPSLQSKFERIISDEGSSGKRSGKAYRTGSSSDRATLDPEAGTANSGDDVKLQIVKTQDVKVERPEVGSRMITGSSGKSENSLLGRWWRAPNNWNVSVESDGK